jgi:hypothetical protein
VSGFGYYGTPMYSDEQRYWMQNCQWIPLEPFMYAFRKGQMKAEIERLAPGLLERDPAGMSNRLAASATPAPDGTPSTWTPAPGPPKSKLSMWLSGIIVTVLVIVALATVDKQGGERGVAFFFAFILGPLIIWRTALSCRNAFRNGSRLLGILFALSALIAALFEIEFLRQWLHPSRGSGISVFRTHPR